MLAMADELPQTVARIAGNGWISASFAFPDKLEIPDILDI